MKRLWSLLALAPSCHHYYKLDVEHVTALSIAGVGGDGSLRANGTLCARGALVEVVATTADGRVHQQGLRTHVDANQYDPALVRLTASSGELHDRSWNPPRDPLALLAQPTLTVTATLVANPAIQQSATFTPTWACDAPVAYVGGGDGSGGSFGVSASEPGKQGGPGGVGQRGADGYHTTVTLGWLARAGGERLAIAHVMTRGQGEAIYVLDATTPLEILANGGNGGGGGTGGFGGATEVGIAGPGGRGGDGGDGGDGGAVVVRYDAASPELQRLVEVENRGGHGGPHGYAGGGGMSLDKQVVRVLDDADDVGRAGHAGMDGPPPVFEAVPDLGARVTALVEHHAPLPPGAPVTPAALEPGHFHKPMEHGDVDGARQYEGDSELELSQPQQPPPPPPIHHRQNLHVESTRTSAGHFTIAFSQDVSCKLELHRPPGGPGDRYVLDAPATCSSPTLIYAVRAATLVIDATQDEIVLTAEGTGSIAKSRTPRGPMAFRFQFSGKRR